jgi:glycerol-3-phosphate O-acyltransferase 3/4
VIKFHGVRPSQKVKRDGSKTLPGIFVANHSSMIDFIILQQSYSYAVVGQKHPGWIGFCQEYLLGCLDPIWFHRGQTKNRKVVAELLQKHAHDAEKTPLLVFPEGTCVNNEYVVQFKQAVFNLGVPINPIAIKYNKVRHLVGVCILVGMWYLLLRNCYRHSWMRTGIAGHRVLQDISSN